MNITAIAFDGFQQAERQLESIANKVAKVPLEAATAVEDTTDLAGAMVGLIQTQRAAEANLLVLHAADELNRKTFEVFA